MTTPTTTDHPAEHPSEPPAGAGPASEAAGTPALARHRPFGVVLLVTGAVGWIASAILVLERLALYEDPGHTTSCDINPWVSCGRVMGTWQSELFGFPNPLIGIVAFAVVLATAMVVLSGARPGRWYWLGLQAGVSLGMVFVAWLWFQALYEIYILCLYCMIVWAAMIPLFILLTARNLAHGVIPAPPGLVRFATDWAGTLIAVVYVAVAGSVFVQFLPAFTGL
ncbi:vitamin K epoxide reductase family protein [Micrococcus terreus]|uniref:vitamin K epoxide reductase family protein n=2 Tax=Micrococcus terreus TaxID=574650 RepID=UPI0021A67D71|nr:vitamin K epoxide reductase family protein [Micrococcus terreus]MCT2090254.1 vitamin K epoxide reductase family protein [Micrococcus terreus]MDK7699987.1 vitamin K epoxide reductase family protein [Micrococcus terreus]WOO98911.1 vitamin K epoxide reductase family protein [Micrococcus terreus]